MTTITITLQSGKSIELTPLEAHELRGQLDAIAPQQGSISESIRKAKERAQAEEFNRALQQRPNPNFPPVTWGNNSDCMHMNCPECHGTGTKLNGSGPCVHMISCPCRRCSLTCSAC